MQILNFGRVPGLTKEEQQQLSDLAAAYNYHQVRNATKDKYYEGHITLNDVNLGIALPQGLHNLEVGCSWGQKAVDVLAARSMFDGFVSTGGSLDSLAVVSAKAEAARDGPLDGGDGAFIQHGLGLIPCQSSLADAVGEAADRSNHVPCGGPDH